MITYKCAHCGVELETEDSLSGKHEACPECKNVNSVPLSKFDLAKQKHAEKAKQLAEQAKQKDLAATARLAEERLRAHEEMLANENAAKAAASRAEKAQRDAAGMSNTEDGLGIIGTLCLGVGMLAAIILVVVGVRQESGYYVLGAVIVAANSVLAATLLFALKWILHYLRRITNAIEEGKNQL